MDKHREVFIEEAYELLAELETSLLELEENSDDAEHIGRVFRSLHTIKGSGAMFGFDDIAEFTHEIETVFDRVRDGKIAVTRELINLSLSARDQIRAMLNAEEIDESKSEDIIAAFRDFLPESEEVLPEISESGNERIPGRTITYRIRFRPAPTILADGTNPILLLGELRELGEAKIVAQIDSIPRLEDYNPESCYIYWDIILSTSEGINAIKDVFIFVNGNSEIRIEVIDGGAADEGSDYKKLGDILIERGDISTQDLTEALSAQKRIGELLIQEKGLGHGVVESALTEQNHVKKMRKMRQETISASSIRVPSEKVDSLVNLVGELVTVQARLSQKAFLQNDPEMRSIAEEVEHLTAELRDNTMSIRMLPIGTTFSKFKRLVRDLSNELDKDAVMEIKGGDTELDKTVLDQLNDPMIHLIRNAMDHGIEPPDIRERLGKPRQGLIHLCAAHSGANVLIRISDDGAGPDYEAIRAKAKEKGLISADADLGEKDIFSLIFMPGFSTAEKVSEVSGRGVGLDIVKRTVESLSGTVEISGKKGEGTTVSLKLPLTLAIIDGLLVKIGDSNFVLPLSSVEECVELAQDDLTRAQRRNMMRFRDELVPYLNLRKIFMIAGISPSIEQVVIVEADKNGRIGFGVDRVIGQHQTVIKRLGKIYKNVEGISGATIMGDGTVALILDVVQLVKSVEN